MELSAASEHNRPLAGVRLVVWQCINELDQFIMKIL